MRKKHVAIDDLYRIEFLREVALSPDGKQVAYTVEWMEKKDNKYYTNLYLVNEKTRIRHFVRGKKDIKNIRWSPNGKMISFVMTEKQEENLWAIPADGGEAYAITKAKGFFGNYGWTPDSRTIVCEFTLKKEDKERIPDKDRPPLYYHIKSTWYKLDGRGMLLSEKQHIWKVSVRSGKMKQLTRGRNGDDFSDISPDGRYAAFSSNRNENFEEKFEYYDVYLVDINTGRERKIQTPAGLKWSPVFSPDGKHLAYRGKLYPEEWVGWRNINLWLVPVKGGKVVNLTKSFDNTFEALMVDDLGNYAFNRPVFSNDGQFLYDRTVDHGDYCVYRIDIKKKKISKVMGAKECIYAFDYDGVNTWALAISNPGDPGNLYLCRDGVRQKITDLNRNYLKTHKLAVPEEIRWKGFGGDEIQGWLLKPPNFRAGRKYPLVVQIHGGPYAAYGNSLFHEFQVLAANGYVVFYSNPHGSVGYGEKFSRDLHNRWGIPDTRDIIKALDVITRRKYVDRKRLGVMGGSYGGFMTNWITGHTDLFKVAVTMRSVVNMLSFWSSDFGFAMSREFKGNWWNKRNFQFYWNMSPIKYVSRMKTPLLIIHSEEDHRCPITQAEELYVALKLLGRDVEMVRFPGEPHGLSRHGSPRRREKRLELILKFIKPYLKKR
ncbi:MAG: S9 family peptidase [candidate division WOR-3 bacterium]|nr:MAG: S9 family peptidase [candidate division WOR-3 bacterium]